VFTHMKSMLDHETSMCKSMVCETNLAHGTPIFTLNVNNDEDSHASSYMMDRTKKERHQELR
jgi:hypothetical protein